MTPSEDLNARMVDRLVQSGSITAPDVEAAFRAIPRHLFLPDSDPELVHNGDAILIMYGDDGLPMSSSSEPAIMATMLEQLSVSAGASILEVGTGSGYNAALLATLAGDRGRVRTLDLEEELVVAAGQHLRAAGVRNVQAVATDGWSGSDPDGPYDRVEVTVGVWDISPSWVSQLAPDGILVVPLWLRAGLQASVALRREGTGLVSVDVTPCGFMRLRGPHSGPESYVTVDGWVLCDDQAAPSFRDAILRLLRSTPTVTPAPELSVEWFTPVALSHPAPVRMWTTSEPLVERQGIMSADRSGLAVVEDGNVMTFGAAGAREELLAAASTSGTRLQDLVVRARPAGDPPDTDDVLVRPAFVYSFAWPEQTPRSSRSNPGPTPARSGVVRPTRRAVDIL